MTLLPVVERELRVAARRRGAFWSRVGACLVLLTVMLWLLWVAGDTFFSPQHSGRSLFGVLCGLTFVLCLGVGGSLTADCLSSEKREGTLGLLFLTDLRGHDVVLGKLAATSLAAFYALLAVLPLLALPVLLGGLTKLAVVGMAVCLVNTMFFSLTAGLLVSAISRDERRAISGTIGLILGITLGLPLLGVVLEEMTGMPGRRGFAELLSTPSPAYGFVRGVEGLLNATPGGPSKAAFWRCQVWVHALSWLFLLLACAILPRTWHETGRTGAGAEGWRAGWPQWWFGGEPARLEMRRRLLAINPVTWLTNRHPGRALAPWVIFAVLALVWFAGAATLRVDWYSPPVAILFALVLQSFFKYQVAAEACRRFAEDRRSGALELLLSTPLTAAEIVRGQRLALARIFAGPLAALLAAEALLLAGAWRAAGEEAGQLAATFLTSMCVTALDCLALAWLGMWLGLRARSYTFALGQTLGWIQFFPWLLWGVATITMVALGPFSGGGGSEGAAFVALLSWWAFVCVVTDIVAFAWAQSRLATRFQAEATGLRRRGGKPARDAG
jgi:ABC-type Na+ efflux pump permease subunit